MYDEATSIILTLNPEAYFWELSRILQNQTKTGGFGNGLMIKAAHPESDFAL